MKKGVHIVVATPGRLKDVLAKKKMNLDNSRRQKLFTFECLPKTPPLVLIFCENKADVDGTREYLLLKRVEAVAVHEKDQEERESMLFHLSNPARRMIGRTGRCGKTGIATTFINKNQSETTLLDLKHLLQEAKQRIPPVLAELNDPIEDVEEIANASGVKGCAYCGGIGHRIRDCPKLEHQKIMQIASSRRDYFGSGVYRGEM
ncbi:DEAD-box ATP-dependent RNA helicase 35 [Forsythia ovata]|uniref:DEAD-box ATP-dependent RNA helicase 35 n=1 Tax=Forsythia ovata TaxID=205694 RepID=A0ABD1X304_9LAMI